MLTMFTLPRTVAARLWRASPPLAGTAALMLALLPFAVAGLLLDPRSIAGAPAWLKPLKFIVSIAIYTTTLAWIFTLLPAWARTRSLVGWTTAATLAVEIAIIAAQAARGTASHFNVATPVDAVLFAVMGIAILVQTVSSVAVAAALWRERFPDAALGWALRLGMTITIAGAFTGGLMTRPTGAQLDSARSGGTMTSAGAHTVGAPDGGPGLPGTGWSTTHGDLRVAHFVGLHAVQVLPIVAMLLVRRRVPAAIRTRMTILAGLSYAALFGVLLAQALRGVSVIAPDASSLWLFGAWAAATALAAGVLASRPRATHHLARA